MPTIDASNVDAPVSSTTWIAPIRRSIISIACRIVCRLESVPEIIGPTLRSIWRLVRSTGSLIRTIRDVPLELSLADHRQTFGSNSRIAQASL